MDIFCFARKRVLYVVGKNWKLICETTKSALLFQYSEELYHLKSKSKVKLTRAGKAK